MKYFKKKFVEERKFIQKTLGEIFSDEVSSKYTTIKNKKTFNKDIITKIKEKGKNIELINIFNVKFIDCLNHFMGFKKLEPLTNMTKFNDIIFTDNIDKGNLLYYSKHYEELIEPKKPKKSKKPKGTKKRK